MLASLIRSDIMVEKHIRTLLADHDCVIIPDFGGLIAQYAPARIHPVKHTFSPPSKRIAFNEKLKLNDGLLINTIAESRQVSVAESQQLVAAFVQKMQQQLDASHRCELKGVGIFRHNAEKKIEFEYVESENYLNHSFGLPELVAKPVVLTESAALRTMFKERAAEQKQVKPGLRSRMKRYTGIAASTLLGGMAVATLYFFSVQNNYSLSSLNPLDSLQQAIAFTDFPEEHAAEKPVQELLFTPEADFYQALAYAGAAPDIAADAPVLEEEPAFEETEEFLMPEESVSEPFSEKVAEKLIEASTEEAPGKIAAAVSETKIEKAPIKPAEAGTNAIPAKANRYYIISNAFSSLENAEKSKAELQQKGLPAKIIMPGKGVNLHRVSLMDFDTKEQALAKMYELEKNYGKTIWVLSY